jgi:hypothetical protein
MNETILDRCHRLTIELDPEVEKIVKLQIEIREVEDQRECMAEAGENTAAFDAALKHLCSELSRLTGNHGLF